MPTAVFNGADNVVANAFANIDGNHQWLDVAPLRPSVAGAALRRLSLPGYPYAGGYRSAAGFVSWQAGVRDALYRGLFKGPLSPGVEVPFEIGLADPAGQLPVQGLRVQPLPQRRADQRCVGHLTAWVAPPTPEPPGPVCRPPLRCNVP